MIEHYLNGRRVVTAKEAAATLGIREDHMRQLIKRRIGRGELAMIPEDDWIDKRTAVYYPEQLGIQEKS